MVQRWVFTEIGGLNETYTVAINPNSGGSPASRRNTYLAQAAGPGGIPIVQSGRLEVQELQFSGDILSQAHYLAMDRWAKKNSTIQIVDDLSRTYVGIFTDFTPQRVRTASNFWKHTFSAVFTVAALAPQGVAGGTSASLFYAKDNFDRAPAGDNSSIASINGIFGNELLSGQPWINSTSITNAYNNINYTAGATPVGYAYRAQDVAHTNYCYTGVKVVQNGDLIISANLYIKNTTGGHVGLYARNQSTTPGNGDAGGGYIAEIFPNTNQIQLAKIGGGVAFATKTLSYSVQLYQTYTMALRLYGTSLALYFYVASGADPFYSTGFPATDPELQVTDATYSNPGYCGFTTCYTDCANIDNFAARGL